MTRRTFFAASAAAGAASAAAGRARPSLCIFSKHMAKLNYQELGKTAKEMGFDGVDLTVRNGGHVLPERAAADMPRAVEILRSSGLDVPMITTGLLTASDPAARPTLATAAKLKIPCYKPGYWRYKNLTDVEAALAAIRRDLAGLVALGKECGIEAGFHNHSGDHAGTAVWDIRALIEGMDPKWIGYYFDPGHATVEGGSFGWLLSTQLVLPRMKMVAIKDFYWEKTGGKWKVRWCPLGEGMVDWPRVFALFAKAKFTGPLSLHVEYDPPDEMAAIAHDLAFMKKQVAAAYGA